MESKKKDYLGEVLSSRKTLLPAILGGAGIIKREKRTQQTRSYVGVLLQ